MVRWEGTFDEVSVSELNVVVMPPKAAGRSIKACLVKACGVYDHTVLTATPAGQYFLQTTLVMTVPSRWSAIGLYAQGSATAEPPTSFEANAPVWARNVFMLGSASGTVTDYRESFYSKLPVLLVGDTLKASWNATAGVVFDFLFWVEYDLVDVDEVTWQSLLTQEVTKS